MAALYAIGKLDSAPSTKVQVTGLSFTSYQNLLIAISLSFTLLCKWVSPIYKQVFPLDPIHRTSIDPVCDFAYVFILYKLESFFKKIFFYWKEVEPWVKYTFDILLIIFR